STPTPEERGGAMKKLIFDDFQSSGKQYRIEFVDDGAEATTPKQEPQATVLEPKRAEIPKSYEFQAEDFLEGGETESSSERGARSEFRNVMMRVLTVLKDVHFARTVCLYWVNKEKQQLVLEAHSSDSTVFTTHRRCELGTDILSQVARTNKPQLVNFLEHASQSDVLPYYDGTESVRTAVAVPVFYAGATTTAAGPVAVLSLDCPEADAYGPETMALLARFAKLISSLIQTYTDKYDMLLDSEVLRSLSRLREQFILDSSAHNITRSIAEEVSRLVPWDYVSIVVYDDARKAWFIQQVLNRMNDSYVPVLGEVDVHRSLVGSVIQSSVPKVVDRVESLTIPRFYPAERCDTKGSLAIVPLISLTRCYGAIVVESKDTKSYADADVRLIQRLADSGSWALEVLTLSETLTNVVSLDEVTGVSTRKHFLERLHEEAQRATDFGFDIAVVLVSVDRMDEHTLRHGKEAMDVVLQSIGQMIKASIRHYDVVGRFDTNRFGAVLVQTNANEATLWAEKVRKNIASNILNIDNKSFTVTVSIGVAGPSGNFTDVSLLENAEKVLKKAVEAGGNLVRVY
ncbi:MAG: sensor domain-containing diguanylate cyclase, partial [Bacteroidetes bacterium]|nr:sensor domain-containing diguanylate cyclase [Bacteroidota bacterium]